MAANKTGAFVRLKYYTPFQKTPLKWIPRSNSGAYKSRPRWAAHTRIGNVWEYPPRVFIPVFSAVMQSMSRHVILPRAFGKEGRNSSILYAKTFMK